MKRFKPSLMLLSALLLVGGCSRETLDIELKSDTFEIGSLTSACESVKSVNGKDVQDMDKSNNTLLSDGKTVTCTSSNLSALGETILVFESKKTKVEKTITMVDTTAPIIHLDKNEIGVEVNNEYFNLKDLIKVTDAFDKNVALAIDGAFDIKVPGAYPVKLIAKDSSGNTSTKDIVITVKEKEKEIVTIVEEREVTTGGSSGSSSSGSSDGSSSNGGGSSSSKGPRPSNKEYLFSDGYTIQSAPSACDADLSRAYSAGWGGSCEPIGTTPNLKGMRLVIYD